MANEAAQKARDLVAQMTLTVCESRRGNPTIWG